MSETASIPWKSVSLLDEVNRVSKGKNNVDMTFKEFLLHVEKDKQQYFLERLKEYQAMLQVIGLLAGVIGTEKEQKDLRDAVMKGIEDYLKTIKVTELKKDSVNYNNINPEVGGYLAGADAFSDLLGLGSSSLKDAANINHQADEAVSQMVKDFIFSLWNSFKKWWSDFWKIYETEGLLIAINRLKIDVAFFVAETALDIGISVALAGAGAAVAAALKGLRFVGQRVGRTVTRVIIKAIPDKPHSHQLDGILQKLSIHDETLSPDLKKILDENNLGGGSTLKDLENRSYPHPSTNKTTIVKTHNNGNNSAFIHYDAETGRPSRFQSLISEDYGGGPRKDNATLIGKTGLPGDQGGHMLPFRYFGNVPDEAIAPQFKTANLSAFKKLENEWADWIKYGKSRGTKVEIRTVMDIDPPGAIRPNMFKVSYEVFEFNPKTGKEVRIHSYKEDIYNNQLANFKRVYFRTDPNTNQRELR